MGIPSLGSEYVAKGWSFIMKKSYLSIILCIAFVLGGVVLFRNVPGDDLASSYIACRLLVEGKDEHIYSHHPEYFHVVDDPEWETAAQQAGFTGFYHPFVQTPLWIWVLQPLCGSLSFPAFNLIFLVMGFLSLAGIVLIAGLLWVPRFLERPILVGSALLILALMTPTHYTAFLNQTQPLFILLMMLAVFFESRDQPILAGILLAIAASVKITPAALALFWLLTKRYRPAISFILSSALLAVLTIALLGTDIATAFTAELRRISDVMLVAYNNQSLAAWLGESLYPTANIFNWQMLPLPLFIKILSWGLVGASLLGAAAVYQLRSAPSRSLDAFTTATVLVASTIFAPIAWSHYYVILIIPIIILLDHGLRTRRYWMIAITCAAALLNIWPIALNPVEPNPNPVTILRGHFFSGVLFLGVLLLVAIYHVRHSRRGLVTSEVSEAG
jgi:hypothetical protein